MFNVTNRARKSWKDLQRLANPVPPVKEWTNRAYLDPLLPRRIQHLYAKLSQKGMLFTDIDKLTGISEKLRRKINKGRTYLDELTYLNLIALELGVTRTPTGLCPAKYTLISQNGTLSQEEGEAVFQCIMEQIHKRLKAPKMNFKYRAKLLRYRTGLPNKHLSRLLYPGIGTLFEAETRGTCGVQAGITLCKALNINPYWLAAGVKKFRPFRNPKLAECFNKHNVRFTSICTPHTTPCNALVSDKRIIEMVADLQGRLGSRFHALLRAKPEVVNQWLAGRRIRQVTRARIYLALNNIFQSDDGFYSLQGNAQNPVSDEVVLSKYPTKYCAQYIQNVHAGMWATNAHTSYLAKVAKSSERKRLLRAAKRQQKNTETLAA